jgi:uncharacterized protein (TIGR02145 family)
MKKLFTDLMAYSFFLGSMLVCLCFPVQAQTQINIYLTGLPVVQLPISGIDSVTYTLSPPPPMMNVYQTNQPVLSFSIWDIDSVTFTIVNSGNPPWVVTSSFQFVSTTTALLNGSATSPDSPITQQGFCWSSTPNPSIADNVCPQLDPISSSFRGIAAYLDNGATIYFRAYAINSGGVGYGSVLSFTTQDGMFTYGNGVTDIDGNEYRSIIFGGKEWMIEDLYVTRYSDGSSIPTVSSTATWAQMNSGASCWSGNNETHSRNWRHGRLYNGYTVIDSRNVCPMGWHIPDYSDFNSFSSGAEMKAYGWWWEQQGDNTSGFTAIGGGNRNRDGDFNDFGSFGYWWANDPLQTPNYIRKFELRSSNSNMYGGGTDNAGGNFRQGNSIRCIKNHPPDVETSSVNSIIPFSAMAGGNVLSTGGSNVTQRGVCWGVNPLPTISDNVTMDGNGLGIFESNLAGTSESTTYYLRAYAINSAGIGYGNQLSFTTTSGWGTITAINCNNATNSGTFTAGMWANGVISSVPYTGGNGGYYVAQTVSSTGVTGLTATLLAGDFAIGSGTLNWTVVGTPSAGGTASFALNIGGQNCTLNATVYGLVGSIVSLNCDNATNSGTLIAGTIANGVSSNLTYTGGNGNAHYGQTASSTGVTGLTATLSPSIFATGSGTLTYIITGTPVVVAGAIGSVTASFALNIGGQSCTLNHTVTQVGSIWGALNCNSANNSGTLTDGMAASGVSSSVPYTFSNGGIHNGQTVNSIGVTGLTATLMSGALAGGSGTLTYTITGTPSDIGTASFALNIAGQNCTLNRTITFRSDPGAGVTFNGYT